MIFLQVSEQDSDREPMGFNCGVSDLERAEYLAAELKQNLSGGMTVHRVQMVNDNDYRIIVSCRPGSLAAVTTLVETSVAIWRRRGWIGSGE